MLIILQRLLIPKRRILLAIEFVVHLEKSARASSY
jgi:hypothetical protein